jgi:NAD(P)-dependent dehydrogenase (short-subunit alcohol dehydrogenase family)
MDRTIVISGGGTGIGRAVARTFAANGDQVTILGRHGAVLAEAAEQLNKEAGAERVRFVAGDLREPAEVERLAPGIQGDAVDVLVNNAGGVPRPDRPEGLEGVAADWRAEFEANVLTAVLLTSALRPRLRRPGGRVVNLSSIAAQRCGMVAYLASEQAAFVTGQALQVNGGALLGR